MTHAFAFGKNWAEFADNITPQRVDAARDGVAKLLPDLTGKSFVDIGCGSGLHSLAALQLGASRVLAIDIDPDSVATARKVLGGRAEVAHRSVFDQAGSFDVVYSWGVLHHTGDMWRAIRHAASLVAPGGTLAIAIYAKTPLCGAWKIEKAIYSRAPRVVQWVARQMYVGAFLSAQAVQGRSPLQHVRGYGERGMRFSNDVHDWLGGHPYESASADEVKTFLTELGLQEARTFALPPARLGLFGTGCNEFVYRRP